MTLPVYVINRAVDTDRMTRFAAAANALGVPFIRIEAIDGHDPDAPLFLYRDYLGDTFWGDDRIKPGAFACALSHRAAWKRMLADGVEMALICEDDAVLAVDPAPLALAAARSKGWDVIFANGRMADWRAVGAVKSDPRLLPLPRIADRMTKAGAGPGSDAEAKPPAPGGDAYLVSRAGAATLVEMLSRARVIAGVDWLIAASGLAAHAAPGPEAQFLDGALTGGRDLRVLVWRDAVADARGAGPSALRHRETLPIAELRDAPSIRTGHGPGARAPEGLRADPVAAAFGGGRFSEEPALEMMARWMPRGGVFVDIGAHIGNHTLFMLRHGGAGRAIPFEHNRFAIEAFRKIMALNGLSERVEETHLGLGLAEEAGRRDLKGGGRNPYGNRLKRGFDEGVKVRPGDALLRDEEVAMIKIDVGGEEKEVLKGLKKTLKRKSPVVVVDETKPRSSKARPLLERLGYQEAERAEWTEGDVLRRVALFRPALPV